LKISIVTPCLNRADLIGATIESVLVQDYSDFEHWIIDGGSSDGTLELLKHYSHLRVVSEADQGVYDAMNKGIRLATGEVIILLNSDDLLVPGALSLSAEIFRNTIGTMIVSSGCQIFRCTPDGREIEMYRYDDPRQYALSLRNVTVGKPNVNARFFRRKIFDQIGYFDLVYSIAADRDFLIRAALRQIPDAPIAKVLYRYRWHAGSLTMNAGSDTLLSGMREGRRIVARVTENFAVNREQMGWLGQWSRECQATEVMIHAVRGRWGKAFATWTEGMRREPRFLFTFLRLAVLAIGRRLRSWWRLNK
jgi:glycosyltransferase involved in cell wall biosynthesis